MARVQVDLDTEFDTAVRGGLPSHAVHAEAQEWGANLILVKRGWESHRSATQR
jgi:nucleotide-binding universal stress UspA family protein